MPDFLPKNIDIKKLFAILVAAVMVSSILGFTFFIGFNDDSGPPVPPDQLPPVQQIISYSASGVNGTIDKILPSAKVGFQTSEFDIEVLAKQLLELPEIKSIADAEFKPGESQGEFWFIADVILDSNVNDNELISLLGSKFKTASALLFRIVIVKIPQELNLKSSGASADLNLSELFALDQPFVESYYSDIQKGDEVILDIDLQLQGTSVVSINAVINSNLSTQNQRHTVNLSAKPSDLETTLLFSEGQDLLDYNWSKKARSLEELSEVDSASIEVVDVQDISAEFSFADQNAELLKLRVQESLEAFPEIKSLQFFKDDETMLGTVRMDWDRTADFNNLRERIRDALVDLDIPFSSIRIRTPYSKVQGTIDLNNDISPVISDDLQRAIRQKLFPQIAGIELIQVAYIDVNSLVDGDEEFTVLNPIRAFVNAGYSTDDDINFLIDFFTIRNEIVFASAVEEGVSP